MIWEVLNNYLVTVNFSRINNAPASCTDSGPFPGLWWRSGPLLYCCGRLLAECVEYSSPLFTCRALPPC